MYSPHPKFIPFFQQVDTTVKHIVNPNGGELIKVKQIVNLKYIRKALAFLCRVELA